MLFSGCATPYQKSGLLGGYNDMKLQDNIYKVTFNGNDCISKSKVQDYALLRAAELTKEEGYRYFTVLEGSIDSESGAITTPITANTYSNYSGGSYNSTTNVYGGQTITYEMPIANLTIECFESKPSETGGMIFDAKQIVENINQKYGIK